MPSPSSKDLKRCIECLKQDKLIVVPTDTIYGILADALSYGAYKNLRSVRRPSGKPFVVLIPDISWVGKLGLKIDKSDLKLLFVKGITVVLPKRAKIYFWIGTKTVAVRIPREGFVRELLNLYKRPLLAPSANPEGKPPAKNVAQAKAYFGDKVCTYVEGDPVLKKPSALVDLSSDKRILRKGPYSSWSIRRLIR